MREIKFRAWVNDSYMAIQGTLDLETFQSFMFHYCDQKIVMQFTGLKDKTGKEIYEGDFLYDPETDDEGNDISTQFQVEYSNQLGCYVIDNSYKRDGSFYIGIIDYFGLENLEVVGNIYENPELLTLNS